ncbi:putative bifunctional diguanylate cyclase/phosphodiesterase [Pelagibacterium luteolum]|uniref:EAL domain, c-di-GMP-specific phosphodiesterase class I (Or its enzymatically inactive variant) n=1 Tax=Pelagibacterium luteolum TaxID=440168 RepID=A0A1G7RTG9_9HYPH|nr:bifunctional diguanylate cyclase/phosphodiesterase [Pelagibacterium luteolum]SDG14045.1 EAL domain, c-di-GMP-specific phosphodiesterase class I (or its enzymatically inactive variant) [Pelagibacterium luteolum]
MNGLGLYRAIARFGFLNYRAKIMVIAFLGTHIPLIGIIGWSVFNLTRDPALIWGTLGVALVATLAGTGATLLILNGLLQPVFATSNALRKYREDRVIDPLPREFDDEAGTLMADAGATLEQLDASLTLLETTDPVTGLLNRKALLSTLATLPASSNTAIVALRLVTYQQIISSFDQTRADAMMARLANRLRTHVGADAHLARVSGPSFAFVAPVADRGTLKAEIAAIIAELNEKLVLDGIELLPVFSAGLSIMGEDGETGDTVLDAAISAASAARPKSVAFFTSGARDAMREAFVLEQDLRTAIDANQLVLHFQPVVDMARGRAIGAEALVRWNHPQHGLVSPARFIPIAERSGLIDDIGLWVMREACAQMARWDSEGVDPITVAVNLSASQFLDHRLESQLKEALAAARIDPTRLEIELTESAAMLDYEHTHKTFRQLKDLGLSVAIDDFGTGYASMSQLRKLPVDKLKIDREFVTNVDTAPDAQAICNAVIALSSGLGLKILAEGTERREEVDYLAARGCNLFQGFYFSKPVSATDLAEAIADISLLAADAADATLTQKVG